MAFKYLAGSLMNLVGTGEQYGATPSGPVMLGVGSADASYPLANAYNGVPALPFRLSAVTTGTYVTFVNNRTVNGDMEQGTTGWDTVSATHTSETGGGNYHKGAASAKLVTTSAGGYIYQDVTVQAGEYLQIWAAAKSDGTNDASVIVRCRDIQKDLSSGGAWTTIGTECMTKTGATMTAFDPVTFQAPTFAEVGRSTVTLRVILRGEASAQTLYFDEVFLVPGIDFAGVFGHGLAPSTGMSLAGSGASYWHSPSYSVSFGSSTNAALARQVAVITNSSRVYDPYPGVFLYPGAAYATYSSLVAPWIGELVVGQTRDFARAPQSVTISPAYRGQTRSSTRGGTSWIYNANAHPVREARLSIQNTSYAQSETEDTEFLRMSEGGRYPLILLPQSLDTDLALYGRVSDTMSFSYDAPGGRFSTTEVTLTEEPLPRL